ncbi:MAG TPA: transglycosylase domain-containing protein, partial [Coriobacteriia bacterium]|nr:transglycosylase domain-containing protein [Coriobacteriia bacterium]
MIALTLATAGGLWYASIARGLPDPGGEARGRDQTSVVFDRNGEEITKLYAEQDRTDQPLEKMSESLRDAVVATEDQRFYDHEGVDPIGIARALWVNIRTRAATQGGSTITQQYVKNAFVTPDVTLERKVAEAILAYRIERDLSKDEILELYLNTIYFGHGAYGVEAAAQTYFGKSVADLDLAESATLAGVIRSPGRYSPYLDPNASHARRATVLQQMTDQGMITEAERAEARDRELTLAGLDADEGAIAPYFMEYVKAQLVDEFGADVVFRGGVSVTTTLDLRMQRAAEQAVAEAFDAPDDPSAALVAIDPKTGEILAMVGGRDFATQQFNVAVQGTGRQPGSAFKPFVLVTALQEGVSPEQTFEAGPAELSLASGQTWEVTGARGERTGPQRLREAMELSTNSVFARLILDVGPSDVVETAHTMGIESDMTPVPAIALGGHEKGVTPLEMATAYGTLAANGRLARPYSIASVTGPEDEVLLEMTPSVTEALDPAISYLVTDVLSGVISRGTGSAADIDRPAAGKTGTTQGYR